MADAPKTLSEALLALQADPPTLTKNRSGHQSKYADLVQVNREVLSRLNALGVTWSCLPTLTEDGKFVLEYELEHVASTTKKSGRWPLKLAENPQQMGSATTYGRRYALLAATGIAAEDEDDDGQAASGRRTAQRAAQPRQRAAAPAEEGQTAQRAQRQPARSGQPPLPGEQPGPSTAQMGMLMGLFTKVGLKEREARLRTASTLLGRPLGSANELTRAEASDLINVLVSASESEDPAGVLAEAMAAAEAAGEGR